MAVSVKDSARNAGGQKGISAPDGASDTQRTFDDQVMEWTEDEVDPHVTTTGRLYMPASVSGPVRVNDGPGHDITTGTPTAPSFAGTVSISGDEYVGGTLVADLGSPQGNPYPTITIEWRNNGVPIPGADQTTYTPVGADENDNITVNVELSNGVGSPVDQTSAAVGPIGTLPAFSVLPNITGNTDVIGSTLTANFTLTGNPAPTPSIQWLRDGGDIPGATSATYNTTNDDANADISVRVNGTNVHGSAGVQTSAAVGPIGTVPSFSVSPNITGDLTVGSVLTVNYTAVGDPNPAPLIQWMRNGVDIPGADAAMYMTMPADETALISANVQISNALGTVDEDATAVGPITSGDIYARNGFSPDAVTDFANNYYRGSGLDTTLAALLDTPNPTSLATMRDSSGQLVYNPHNYHEDTSLAGAVVGDIDGAGSWPTGWTDFTGGEGEIVATGTEDGVPYIDVKWTEAEIGATSGNYINAMVYTSTGDISVAVGDTFLYGIVARIVDSTNVTTLGMEMQSAAGHTTKAEDTVLSSSDKLIYREFTATTTTPGQWRQAFVLTDVTTGFDFTIRFKAPRIYKTPMANNPDRTGVFASLVENDSTAAIYLPRVGDHYWNGSAWENLGVAHEQEARTNLITYANALITSPWVPSSGSAAYDTSTNVLTFAGDHYTRYNLTLSDNTNHVYRAELEHNGDTDWVLLFVRNKANNDTSAYFNMSTGLFGTTSGAGTWDIVPWGGGWIVYCVFDSESGATTPFVQIQMAYGDGDTSSGGGGNFIAKNVSVDEGSTLASFVPTNDATFTRPADPALEIAGADMAYAASMSGHIKGRIWNRGAGSQSTDNTMAVGSRTEFRFVSFGGVATQYSYFSGVIANANAPRTAVPGALEDINSAFYFTDTDLQVAEAGVAGSVVDVTGKNPPAGTDTFKIAGPGNGRFMGWISVASVWDESIGLAGIVEATS